MRPSPLLVSVVVALVATACALEPHDYGPGDDAGMDVEPEAEQSAAPQPDADSGSSEPETPADAGTSDTPISNAFPCAPLTCTSANASCGTTSDGCGGTLDCGACPLGEECGGAGLPNHCAAASDGGPDADAGPSCSPGERACVGLQTYECDPSGNWVTDTACSTVCVNGACEDTCPLPWGGTLAHGQSTTAYLNVAETSPTTCDDHMETRTCNNGVLSGSYTNPACVQHYRDCPLSGYGTLLHGTQVTSYAAPTVPCGSTCTSVTLSCSDGVLSGGSGYHGSCAVDSCDCHFSHGQGFSTLSPGESCSSDLVNVNTTSGCTGGIQQYASYHCTYTCNSNGTITRSPGGPCELGNGACGGSVSGYSTTTCPDGW